MFHLLWVPSWIKTGAKFSVGTKFTRIYNFGLRSSLVSTIFTISMLDHKSWSTLEFWDQVCPILGQDPQFSNIIFKINKLGLLGVQNFIPFGIYFIFGTKFSWNEGIDTWYSNMCYLAVILIFLVVTWWLLLITYWLLLVTGWLLVVSTRYHLLLLVLFPVLVWMGNIYWWLCPSQCWTSGKWNCH